MNIAIIDDIPQERKKAISYIRQFFEQEQEHFLPLHFVEFDSGEDFFEHYEDGKFDLLILDIFMKGISGFEIAKKLFQKNSPVQIIFFTNSTDYVLQGYSLHVAGYVLKPLDKYFPSFFNALEFVCKTMAPDTKQTSVRFSYGEEYVFHKNIYFVEYSMRKFYLHCTNGDFAVLGRYLDYRDKFLSDSRFVECHRSVIVNMDFIEHINETSILLKSKTVIPISRRKKYDVLQKYNQYLLRSPL